MKSEGSALGQEELSADHSGPNKRHKLGLGGGVDVVRGRLAA